MGDIGLQLVEVTVEEQFVARGAGHGICGFGVEVAVSGYLEEELIVDSGDNDALDVVVESGDPSLEDFDLPAQAVEMGHVGRNRGDVPLQGVGGLGNPLNVDIAGVLAQQGLQAVLELGLGVGHFCGDFRELVGRRGGEAGCGGHQRIAELGEAERPHQFWDAVFAYPFLAAVDVAERNPAHNAGHNGQCHCSKDPGIELAGDPAMDGRPLRLGGGVAGGRFSSVGRLGHGLMPPIAASGR